MINRLKLDFSIEKSTLRKIYVATLLDTITFTPNEEELEMAANYILWGKDDQGLNAVQRKLVDIPTRDGAWATKAPESLDALLEDPAFSESRLFSDAPAHPKREVFSRDAALKQAPPEVIPILRDLFRHIDETDFTIGAYELAHGKRTKPIRPQLANRFSEAERTALSDQAARWTPRLYLKKRHLLIELRRQQYTLRDSFAPQSCVRPSECAPAPQDPPLIGEDIAVLPLSLYTPLLFMSENDDARLPVENMGQVSDELWRVRAELERKRNDGVPIFDFRDPSHIAALLETLEDWKMDIAENTSIDSSNARFLETLDFYINLAHLSDIQREIFRLKLEGKRNQDIVELINIKYGKTYTANYISTIYRQKILGEICAAASYHEVLVDNIFYPENWKKCNTCGKYFLRDPANFVRKTRASDGFTGRCKWCDKIQRGELKDEKGN